MTARLLGLGTAVPAVSLGQELAADLAAPLCADDAGQARLLATLYRRARVRRRGAVFLDRADPGGSWAALYGPREGGHDRGPGTAARMALYARHAPPLAAEAATRALAAVGLAPARITHLVTVSCTGFSAPGLDIALIGALGLPAGVERAHVGFMGCHGLVNGLRVAAGLAAGRPEARVLLCAVELCSLHFQYGWDPEAIVANALFADGAAALVLADDPAEAPRGPAAPWRLRTTGSRLVPDSAGAMTWTIGDHGFRMTLSPRVPELIGAHLRPWLASWLDASGCALRAVRSWAIHPGGPRILDAVESGLALPAEALAPSREVLAAHGNMSSPTLAFILQALAEAGTGGPCVALAFGPGLEIEALLLD